ncbi:MAG TPA: hypothetical protein VJ783_04720 [Pirellulales bacterium]|nr:hypothetical protein [Pirellulales bacterium]
MHSVRRNWLAAVPIIMAAVAAVALLQGRASGPIWVLALIGTLAGCVALDRRFRQSLGRIVSAAWSQANAFPLDRARIPWRAVLVLVIVPDALLLLARGGGVQSGDSRPVVMTAVSLTGDGNAELSELVEDYSRNHLFVAEGELPYFVLRRPTGLYSHYPSGMVPFALPVVLAARALGADLFDPSVHDRLEKATASLVAAACLGLFFALALHVVPIRTAYVATCILATGSVMYSTVGQALWQHGGVILWTETLLLAEFRAWRNPSWRTAAIQGTACALMLACRLSAAVIVVAFGVWLLIRSPRRAAAVAGLACLVAAPWAAVNWSIYASPMGPMAVQTQGTFWSFTDATAWAGIFVSPTHGVLVYQPWLLVALLGVVPFFRGKRSPARAALPPGWRAWALAVIGLHMLLIGGWWCWWGGWCWGSRLASEAIPLAALLMLQPLAALLAERRGRRLVMALALASALLHVPSVWLRQWRWYGGMEAGEYGDALWHWSAPPFLYPLGSVHLVERNSFRSSQRK